MIETARRDTTIFAPTTRGQSMVAAHLVTPTWLARRRLAVATARTTGRRVGNGSFHRQASWIWRAVSSNKLSTPVAKSSPRPSSQVECSASRALPIRRSPVRRFWRSAENSEDKRGVGHFYLGGDPITAEQLYNGGTRAGIRANACLDYILQIASIVIDTSLGHR